MAKNERRHTFDGPRFFAAGLVVFLLTLMIGMMAPLDRAEAACTVPNQISNGQVADATVIMGNFNAVKACVDSVANSTVTPSGTPASGNLAVFSGPMTVTNGDLSGDCSTAGTTAVICTKTNGSAFSYFATGTDAAHLTGTISPSRFDTGINADSTHFLRGDGVWAIPSGTGGGGGGGGTPVVRASTITSFNAGSVTIPWPTGTLAGDVVIIFVSDGYAINNPTGWTILNNTGGNDWANGLTAAKVMTSADITAASVTVTLIGSYNGVAAATTIDGGTMTGLRQIQGYRPAGSSSYSSAQVAGLYEAISTDLIIGFTYVRGTMNPSISNFTQLQLVNAANASAFLGQYSTTLGKLGVAETATYPSSNNGYYWSLVALR